MQETFMIGRGRVASAIAGELATPGTTPPAATSSFAVGGFLDATRLIKDPAVSTGTWPARYETLENLASGGAEVWYPEFRFATPPGGRRGREVA
jgi:hypothetical protein